MQFQRKPPGQVDLRVSRRRKTRYIGDFEPDNAQELGMQKACQRGLTMGSDARRSGLEVQDRKGSRPIDGRKNMMYAEMELVAGNVGSAIEFAKQTLKSDPGHVGALEILAKAQWQASQCDELLLTLRKLIELNPYEPGYHSLQAGAYQSLGLCGEAVKSYLRAVDLGVPKSAEMDAMIEDLRSWQGSLVAELLVTDKVFKAAYLQDPAKACADRGFDFAIPPETTEHLIRERESRAVVFARPS
jgi:hypothetical protein